jgi:tetratricopeptide (TPR) repeat protein
MSPRPIIFISAVSKELRSARQLVANTLTFLGYEPEWQDVFGTEQGDLRAMLRRRVDAAQGVVQLVGACYGVEPEAPDTTFGRCSYTQYEALYAHQRGKKVWYLFIDGTFPTDAHAPEPAELTTLQDSYRARVRADGHLFHALTHARDVENSVLKLRDDLSRLRRGVKQWAALVLVLLALCTGGVVWLLRSGGQQNQKLSDTGQQLADLQKQMAALTAATMQFAETKSRSAQESGPKSDAAVEDATYAALGKQLGLDPKLLREKLPDFAKQLQQNAESPAFQRANAAYVVKDYVEAERLALQAAHEAATAEPPRNPDAIAAYNLAGQAAEERIQYAQARRHFDSAAALTSQARDLLAWADVQNQITWLLHLNGKYREAEALARAVWEACRVAGRAEEPIGMAARNRWANALSLVGDFRRSETEYRELIKVRQRVLGPEHLDTLRSRHNLAVALAGQEKNAEAEEEDRAVLAIRERVLGPEHPDTLRGRNNLATTLSALGKHAEAEQEHRAVLAIQERVLGPEHPESLQSRMNLAVELYVEGKEAEAEAGFRTVLALQERVLGPEHPDTLASRMNLANALKEQGKHAEAEADFRAVLAIQERVLGAEHRSLFLTCNNLAAELLDQGKNEEALAIARRAEEGWRKVLGQDHPRTRGAEQLRKQCEAALAK